MIAHLLFEQSGSFKSAFARFNVDAYDYDIRNQFGQTDFVVDLFSEIEKAFVDEKSIFDNISTSDLVFAFFPCTYFCENNRLYFNGTHNNLSKLSLEKKLLRVDDRSSQRQKYYSLLLKLFYVCEHRHLRLIVENPYSVQSYLYNNLPIEPTIIDKCRALRGDGFKKPTAYYFLNLTPTWGASRATNTNIKSIQKSKSSSTLGLCSEDRSKISPTYAYLFLKDFIFGAPLDTFQLTIDFEYAY